MAKPASSPESRASRQNRDADRARTRYGSTPAAAANPASSRTAGKIIAIVSVLFLVLILVFVGRYITQRRAEPISASLVAHERIDDTTSRVWFDVSRNDPEVPGYCIITSLNYEHAEIGRRDIVLPGGGEEQTRMYVDIPVRDLPVSGGVYGCSTTIPSFLDAGAEYVEAR